MQRIRNFIRLKKKKKENARREQGACITNDCEVRERVCGGSYLDNIHNELQVCVIRAYSSSSVLFSEVYKEFTPHISMVFPGIEIPRERELHWVPKKTKQENGEIEKIVKRVRSKLGCNSLSVDGLVGMQSRVIDDVKAMQLMEPDEKRNMTFRAETLSRMRLLEFLKIKRVGFSGSINSISSELRYLEWDEYPFTYFPSGCKLSKLLKLILRRSNIKQLWDGTMVNLSGCSRLFGGTELENGSESGIQCQSTIWSTFKRLKLRLPFHFFNSSKSRYNRVFHLWRLSVARLSCVYYLDLSCCNLHTIPEAISSLHYLEILVFWGNNIVRVPDFINKLPRLRVLDLDNCKRLMYVDEFPLPLHYPAAELTKLAKWRELRMWNCPKIVEKERLSGMESSWMREYIKVHNESTDKLAIVIPGGGVPIPRWFKDQNKGADNSMWIESFLNANDNNWIGIALCAQFVVQFAPFLFIELSFYDQTGKANLNHLVVSLRNEEEVRGELVHFCLFYFSRQQLIRDGKQHDLHGSRFEFKEVNHRYVEVKKWGMRVILDQDMDTEEIKLGVPKIKTEKG
ncbi:hypothetical protein Ahy_B03g061753 isoform C [Arachis hypogaea]|uniref:Uncharacterized protein n=1 Tax=Arachis hypogaea TaxID=3818 RepID=A0A444ZRU9_ARAHY|nr:hypothetical protein Ahy_B03g061753 isoform C [Arachis hypogaea]